jgi:hypothetical protein
MAILSGCASQTDSTFLSMVELFELVSVSRAIAEAYSQIARDLRANWRLIGVVVRGSFLLFC